MITFALKGMLSRKLRTALTAIAVVLGVAMVSGTYVLTDSIDKAFDQIFTEIYQGTDATITPKSPFDTSDGSGTTEAAFDESLLPEVRALPDVEAAIGGVAGEAQLIGDDGKAIVFGGAPNLGFSVDPARPEFNSLTLEEGQWPGAGELVVDISTADKENLEVGEQIGVQAEEQKQTLTISGLVRFGSVSTIGGATLAGFDLPTAQKLFDKVGKLDQIRVAAKAGVGPDQLVASIAPILPANTEVRTGSAQAQEDAEETDEFISFLQQFLLAFAGVALFVGAFVIANSLSITIAQRAREFATLRTLGASRRQVLGTIVLEGLVIGILASIVGLFLGLGLASGLFALFDAVGFTLPNSGLTFGTRTVVVALTVGIVVTLIASLRPAFRATRVPPIAAVREGAVLPPSRFARFRTPASLIFTLIGFALILWALFGASGTTPILLSLLFGALIVFIGVALLSMKAVPTMAVVMSPVAMVAVLVLQVIVWPFFTLPYWLQRYGLFGPGPVGKRLLAFLVGALNVLLLPITLIMWLRRALTSWEPEWPAEFPNPVPERTTTHVGGENARRNPQRTASTASALMIGLALVTLVATLAAGIIASFEGAVEDIWRDADYAITAQNNFSPIPIAASEAVAETPGVRFVANVRTGEALVNGSTIFMTAINPPGALVFNLDWVEGSNAVMATLGPDGAFVDEDYAEDNGLSVGSTVGVTFVTGETKPFTIKGVFDPPTGGSPFGNVTISESAWDTANPQPKNLYSFVQMQGGVSDANQATLDEALVDFPNAKAQTKDEFVDNQISGLSAVLNILYVLLALSVIVSLFGIVNTLVLTVFERTREIGMLRAVGMTRRQVRRMIRHESVITALIGAIIGIILGLVLGALLISRVDFLVFSLPVAQLIIFTVAAVIVGIVAAIFPARRAAKLDPLEALQYE